MNGPDLCICLTASGAAVRLSVSGDLDVATAPYLRAVLQEACGERAWIDVDLSAVTFLDCAGLRPLTETHDRIGTRFAVVAPSPPVVRFLALLQEPTCACAVAGEVCPLWDVRRQLASHC